LLSRKIGLCKYLEGGKMGRRVTREGEIFNLCYKSR